jgi:hypothetical protein
MTNLLSATAGGLPIADVFGIAASVRHAGFRAATGGNSRVNPRLPGSRLLR